MALSLLATSGNRNLLNTNMRKTIETTSRELEIRQLELAIKKTLKAQMAAQQTKDKLYEKLLAQKSELLLQKSLAFIERRLLVVKG